MAREDNAAAKRSHALRNALIGAAVTLITAIGIKLVARRLRSRPDPEQGDVLSEPLGESGRHLECRDHVRLYAEELGTGPTIVLIHGWFCNTDMWHYQKKFLSDHFRMVCYDQRGHARSECPDGRGVSLAVMAEDLRLVLDEFARDEPVVLVGHSMGGFAALKYAEMYPEELGRRVRGVALVDTSNVPMRRTLAGGSVLHFIQKPVVEPLLRFVIEHPELSDRIKDIVLGTAPFLVATRYLGYGSGASLTQMEYITEMAGKTTMKGACQAGLGLLERDETISLDRLRDSGIPVMIWVGAKDRLTRPEVSEEMCRMIPGSELHVIPDTGHPSYMEEYRLFNRVLTEFADRAHAGGRK